MKKKWIIVNKNRQITRGNQFLHHETQQEALDEAIRLCEKEQVEFIVFEATHSVLPPKIPVNVVEIRPNPKG